MNIFRKILNLVSDEALDILEKEINSLEMQNKDIEISRAMISREKRRRVIYKEKK